MSAVIPRGQSKSKQPKLSKSSQESSCKKTKRQMMGGSMQHSLSGKSSQDLAATGSHVRRCCHLHRCPSFLLPTAALHSMAHVHPHRHPHLRACLSIPAIQLLRQQPASHPGCSPGQE